MGLLEWNLGRVWYPSNTGDQLVWTLNYMLICPLLCSKGLWFSIFPLVWGSHNLRSGLTWSHNLRNVQQVLFTNWEFHFLGTLWSNFLRFWLPLVWAWHNLKVRVIAWWPPFITRWWAACFIYVGMDDFHKLLSESSPDVRSWTVKFFGPILWRFGPKKLEWKEKMERIVF